MSGLDFVHLATATVYRNDNGTGGQTTSYSYTFTSGTNQIASTTATLPTVTPDNRQLVPIVPAGAAESKRAERVEKRIAR
ncbi:hypothetical protein R5W23_001056 [Gemmata sp. JC673]|uniref:Uncharacterized protein n=1 Tax=Gemmata algarum TaxID=2975278 RepID=A0ABU5ES30_9BACT|nr:hypothetical protein [Gemmata algarum]MDY3558157.1 hypothetical protein [Gemmata algarum]